VKLRPYYLRPLKDRNVCCCQYYMELDMLREGINNMRDARRGVHAQCTCDCELCASHVNDSDPHYIAHEFVFKGITKLWLQVVCPKLETKEWYKYSCLMENCDACGMKNLLFFLNEIEGTDSAVLTWRCFCSEAIGTTNNGQQKKKIKEVFMQISTKELLEYLQPKLTRFIAHNFVARWQDNQCHLAMENLPDDAILSHIDFAKNYSFQI
jgi:hypothetical protein